MTTRPVWTLEDVRALGVRTDLETAASIWGIGRTRAYELARAGEFPSQVVRVGATYIVPVLPLLAALGAAGLEDTEGDPVRSPSAHVSSLGKESSHVDGRSPAA